MGEKNRVAATAREKLDMAARLALVSLKAERQLAITRGKLGLNSIGNGGNPAASRNFLWGL
jgi:hypothetical protein